MSTTWRVSCWTRQYSCKGDMIVQWVDCILSSIFTSVLFFKIQDTLFKCLGIKEGLMLFVASCCFSKVSNSQCGNGNAMAGTSCMTWSWWSTPRMWPTTTPATRWPGGARLVSPTMAISTLGHRRCGAEVWTCYGHLGRQTVTCSGITFRSLDFDWLIFALSYLINCL